MDTENKSDRKKKIEQYTQNMMPNRKEFKGLIIYCTDEMMMRENVWKDSSKKKLLIH